MYLYHIFLVKPFAALSILLCLSTILACVMLERRRPHQGSDRFLIAVLGLLSVWQGMRILQGTGLVTVSMGTKMDDVIELAITAFYLMAAMLLRLSAVKSLEAESALRLARAAPPRSSRNLESARGFSLETISWAMPRVSDGAFKLYAFLCLRAGYPNGGGPVGAHDIRLQLGKTKDEVEAHVLELEKAGAVTVQRDGGSLNIELLAQARRGSGPIAEELPRATVTLPA